MTDEHMRLWVRTWAHRYPADHDRVLVPLHGAANLDRSAVLTVVDWKFSTMRHRRAKARTGVASEPDQTLLDVTAAARTCVDDGAAMRVVRVLQGVGPALGSALLMTMDPDRWTVLDERAVASIRAIGYTDVPSNSQSRSTWIPYLQACREVRDRTGYPLREVDRALYTARDESGLSSV